MEVDEEIQDTKKLSKKHEISESNTEVQSERNIKKVKLFAAKEFRKKLRQDDRVTALKQFLNAINESNGHDYVLEYLESGGNCLELLQTLELDSTLSPVLVFELVAHVLLKVTASGPQYHSAALESCRYLLKNYITVINKMINLSSRGQERKACLKLLTAMITFSSTLAKDILLQVNFHTTNVELLTKSTGEENSVRDHFIHFLTAFLIDGHYPSLSVLLDKKGFITSIIKGLQFDVADTVCIVISAMKNHILENNSVSKTAKMKIFNTLVVRDIVNLYNWKGPAALKTQEKNKSVTPTVDEYSKSKVNECVHDFLMVLCTSHRYGVIFKDHSLGLGKKHQNALMYTVLESLERPWEHSYACELVTKICAACPDLTKTMWTNLKTSLEPRMTEKWLNAMQFAKSLLRELQPSCIEFCARELNINQLAQIIQILVSPLPVLKTVLPEDHTFTSHAIKRQVLSLFLEMLRSLNCYIEASNNWLTVDNHRKLKLYISSYVIRHFLDANAILNDWETENVDCDIKKDANINDETFLEIVFDIFDLYNKIAPQLLDSLNSMNFQLTEFLKKVYSSCDDENISARLQVKVINIFIDLEPANFSANTELFSFVLPLLLKFYYNTVDLSALTVLNKLLRYTGIFDGCLHEVNIWINGVLNLESFDEGVAQGLLQILKTSAGNVMEFSEELSLLGLDSDTGGNFAKIIEKLKSVDLTFEAESIIIKHKYMSPMVLGLVNYLKEETLTTHFKSYMRFVLLNLFHCQTQMEILKKFVQKYEVIPKYIRDYILCWTEKGEITYISLGKIPVFESFSVEFLSENTENALESIDIKSYPDLPLNLLETGIFFLTNSVINSIPAENYFKNCLKFIKHLIEVKNFHESYIETVLAHPVLVDHFSLLSLETDACTTFLLGVIKLLLDSGFEISRYLKIYREKSVKAVFKILKKPKKYNFPNFVNTLELFDLSYDQCRRVLTTFAESSEKDKHFIIILDILWYTLKRFASLYGVEENAEPLEGDIIQNLTAYFVRSNESQQMNVAALSEAFHKYFEVFPHNIKDIHPNLLPSLVNLIESNKENVTLMTFLLERHIQLLDSIKNNLNDLCNNKGVLLPVLEVLVRKNVDEDILKQIYELFEASLTKALIKPQKSGQHFHVAYSGLTVLIEKFMSLEKCKNFANKVQKFEVTEVFHVKLLEIVFNKVIEEEDFTAKQANNIILTFVHLQVQVFKRSVKNSDKSADLTKVNEVAKCFNNILRKIHLKTSEMDLKNTAQNETLKAYITYCLKFGMSGQTVLLKSLRSLIKVLINSMDAEDGKFILDMMLSHSEFLDIVLEEHTPVKLEVLSVFLTLCRTWNEFMQRYHIPVLLGGYRAMINACDRIIWTLLKMYEKNAGQTSFHDFKPFLWGRAAANHYSVRHDNEKSLWRQPKMRDILDILQEEYVLSTIFNYPLNEDLQMSDEEITEIKDIKSYDVKFLLPLFSQMLAAEQQVQTYAFTRSGGLSLTVMTLSSDDRKIREAACHVLSRFHFHVDASQQGKDNLLWLRYVEAVCRGVAQSPDKKLNNFSAVYLSRMALILTQPNHVMYVPLSNHLIAKSSLNFSTVPELYTFLHSSDINYKEHRHFILELLRDGLRSEKDFTDFLRSMALKLFSELYNSSLADLDTKLLVLDVIRSACRIPLGAKMVCENNSLLTQLFSAVNNVLMLSFKEKLEARFCVTKIMFILLEIVRTLQDVHPRFMAFNTALKVVKDDIFSVLTGEDKKVVFEVLYLASGQFMDLFTDDVVELLIEKSGDKFCRYVVKYGCEFVDVNGLSSDDVCYYLRLLIFNKMKT